MRWNLWGSRNLAPDLFLMLSSGRSSVTVNANTKYQRDIVKRGYNSEVGTTLWAAVLYAKPVSMFSLEEPLDGHSNPCLFTGHQDVSLAPCTWCEVTMVRGLVG